MHLPVMEQFYTIQGEGFHQGKAAYFIRTAGCDVGCFWCDVKDSWDATKYPQKAIDNILSDIKKYPVKLIVVTGGEPLMHNLDALTEALKKNNYRTHLETSGAYPLSGNWDWICFSPKKFKQPLAAVALKANELKVVVQNSSDYKWAEENKKQVADNCKLFLQPEWSKRDIIMPGIIEYVKANPEWQISVQVHKFINVP